MAPRQNTFTVIPNPLGMQGFVERPAAGRVLPAMTSKQAQKLHRQATRGPKLSKAEQRRIEREEQERIRRELEKEKQVARARSLRERKKAKEQLVVEAKKRKGLPLVDVRPSQDTITRFVRGNGTSSRKRGIAETTTPLEPVPEHALGVELAERTEPFDNAAEHLCTQMVEANTKRLRTASIPLEPPEDNNTAIDDRGPPHKAESLPASAPNSMDTATTNYHIEIDDRTFKYLFQSQFQDEMILAANSSSTQHNPSPLHPESSSVYKVSSLKECRHISTDKAAPQIPPLVTSSLKEVLCQPLQQTTANIQTPPGCGPQVSVLTKSCGSLIPMPADLLNGVDSSNRSGARHAVHSPREVSETSLHLAYKGKENIKPSPLVMPDAERLSADAQKAMPPPPLGHRYKPPINRKSADRPKFLANHNMLTAGSHRLPVQAGVGHTAEQFKGSAAVSMLPTSTQLFVLAHLDEILPSPSQELRELQEPAARPSPFIRPQPPIRKPPQPNWKPPPSTKAYSAPTIHSRVPSHPCHQVQLPKESTLPFFSTQDFVLSSQDVRDLEDTLETPSKLPNRGVNNEAYNVQGHRQNMQPPPRPSNFSRGPAWAKSTLQQTIPAANPGSQFQDVQASRYSSRSSQRHTSLSPSKEPFVKDNDVSQRQAQGISSQEEHGHIDLNAPSEAVCPNPAAAELPLPVQPVHSLPIRAPSAGLATPRPLQLPSRGRFFTSSNEKAQLAMERSLRSHREELREREIKEQQPARLGTKEVGETHPDGQVRSQHEIGVPAQRHVATEKSWSELRNTGTVSNPTYAEGGGTRAHLSLTAPVDKFDALEQRFSLSSASQETDYGDLDLAAEDLECLSTLDRVATVGRAGMVGIA